MKKFCRKGHLARSGKRWLALLMSVCLIGTMIPITARAENGSTGTGLCEHHTGHTEDCGYKAPTEGHECEHVHDESCGYQEASECTHVHTEACGENGESCTHEHDEECGYLEGHACGHEHDDECGYVEAFEGSPCTFVCDICGKEAEPGENNLSDETLTQTPEQAEGKLITAWQWIDEEEYLDEETGNLALLGASEENLAYFADVTAFLPTQIMATVEDAEDTETITLGDWSCDNYPVDGAYSGSYIFTVVLPEGYILSEGAKALSVTVDLGGAALFSVSYTAPSTDASGVYQISTAEDLYWFAQYVNEGNTSANAVLTQNISASSMTEEWTPIGTESNPYAGTFDGQGHTISGLKVTGTADYVGLFGFISNAYIQNVGVTESSFQGNQYVGGICGYAEKKSGASCRIESCFSTASVSGNKFVGGFCGYDDSCLIFNSYSAGTVTGEGSFIKMFCGLSVSSSVFNCYYLSESDDWGRGYCKTQEQFASGEVAYLLSKGYQYFETFKSGDIWGQSIGADGLPVFNGEEVSYASGQYHNHAEEYCPLCSGEPSQKNGVYQLCTAEHLYWLAGLVNGTTSGLSQNVAANAVLCADITINQDVTDTSGLQAWTPVGTQTTPYTGTFDGQGHTISGLYVEDTAYGGLFGNTGDSAEISNVGVINSKIFATTAAGGICGENGGTIHDCYNGGTISSLGTAGGICGINGKTIEDCYSTGAVSGSTASGGVYGSTSGEGINNCYYLADAETNLSDGTAGKTQEQFESGEVCYLLNGSRSEGTLTWGQVIGRDTVPVFGEKAVFYARNQYHNHTGDDCSLCAGDSPEQIDGVYQLYTADDLYWFAGLVNGTLSYTTQNTKAEAVLKADITVNEKVLENGSLVDTFGLRVWTPIGTSGAEFEGTFHGGGYTISGLYLDTTSDYVGLFGDTINASISNVTVADSYFSGNQYVGGVIGCANDGTVTDCHNTESVCVSGTECVGGVFGCAFYDITVAKCYNMGSVSGTNYVGGVVGRTSSGTVTDCYNTGSVSGTDDVGGIIGGGSSGAVAKNSYNTGSVSGTYYVGDVVGSVSDSTVQNCYYLSESETDSIAGTSCKTDAQFESGEVAWLLNANRTPIVWGQNLGVDVYPVLNGPQVYATYPCLSFSNEAFASENKEHNYDETGTCTVCGDASKPTVIDGVYQISNEVQLYWFAGLVNGTLTDGSGSDKSAKAVLTADITVNRGVLNADGSLASTSGLKDWTPIGTNDDNRYTGTFDGQGHTISGLYLDTKSDYVGLFGYTYAASISNVTVADSYLSGNQYVGGVIGFAGAGSATGCSNAGSVSGTGNSFVGGVIGHVASYTTAYTTVTDCYNTGNVSGTGYNVGGVAGSTSRYVTLTGCYNTGSVSGTGDTGGVLGGGAATVTGCYNTGSVSGTGSTSQGVGGVIGYVSTDAGSVKDCYNTGSVSGYGYVGGMAGYVSAGSFTNCYYLSDSETDSISGTSYKTAAQFAGGEVVYLLNGSTSENTEENPLVWYQNLGENGDASPVRDNTHGIIYQCTGCAGTYSNTKNEVAKHSFQPVAGGTTHKCEKCGAEEAHSTTNLTYSANEFTNKITVSCGECGENLGYVQLNAPSGDLSYDNSAKKATVSDEVTDIDFSFTAITYSTADGSAPKDAGTYTASITLGDGEGAATVSVEFIIARATPNIGTVSATSLNNTLDVLQVQLSRENNTVLGTLSLEEGTSLQYGSNNCTYLFTPTDEENYKSVTGSVTITVNDTIAPTAEYQIGENGWKKFVNTISFGLFCKDYKTVEITYSDVDDNKGPGSGVKTKQYYIANKELTTEEIAALQWSDYSDTISLDAKGVYFIYVKVEDNAGNTVVLNSEGIVIYAESTISPTSLDYTYKGNADLAVQIAMNGNTFGKLTDAAGTEIAADNYTIDGTGKLTLNATYLDTLKVGEYTYKVCMNPQGQVTTDVTLEYRFVVNVKVRELTVTSATATDRVYDTTNVVTITAVTLDGVKSGDDVSVVTTNLKGTLSSANAGDYTSVTLPTLELTGTAAENYTLVQPTGAVPTTVTISKAGAQITVGTETYSKTFGDADFNLDVDVTDTNTEANIQYVVTAGDDVVSVSNGTVTILKAGTATITVSLPASTNYNAATSKTITVNVAKKSGYTVADISRSCLYSRDNADTIDLSGYLPANCGNVTYGTPQVNGDLYTTDGQPAVSSNGELSYKVKTGSVGDTGTIKVTVTTDNYEDFTITVKVELIDKISVSLKEGSSVTLQNNTLTYGETLSKLAFNSAVFVDDDGNEVAGTLAWKDATIKPNAGTTSATWVFTPSDESYANVEGSVGITVNRATPYVTAAPTVAGRTYDPNNSLTDSDLTGGNVNVSGSWRWQSAGIIPTVNNSGYVAVFTPTDTINYETVTRPITVTVSKATPVIVTAPTANAITYGDTLGVSTLTGGTVQYSDSDSTTVAGSFAWADSSIKPSVSDSNTTTYQVVFTPSDTVNYNTAATAVTLTVNKAENAPNMPSSTMNVANSCAKVSDVTLPTGWVWQDTDKDKELTVDTPVTATAVYNGADAGNYVNETVSVTITRSACDHAHTELRNAKAATCKETGYTGDTYCTDCEALLTIGSIIPLADHQGGTATCNQKAVCTVCGQEYGEVDANNHVHTEIRGAAAATCTAGGYTGDTYCTDCGVKIKTGTATPALGHNYTSKVTTEPTTDREGVRTYTCTNCGHSYTESIPKLPAESHSHSYSSTVTKAATCTDTGVRTYTCSCGDSYTETIPALGHHYVSSVTKQPTTESEGVMTYTCDRCGHSYTRPIEKLQDTSDNQPENKQPGDNHPGDNNSGSDVSEENRPDTGKPFIKNDAGKKGWDVIRDVVEKAKDGETITVDMNGATVVPGDVLNDIKGRDITIVFDMGDGITWSVNGQSITTDKVGDIDFSVRTGTNMIPVDVINNVTGERFQLQISLAYDGEFGFTAVLSINMDKKNAGLYANLFYYNEASGELEFICADEISADGTAELTFTHASDYTIVIDKEPMDGSAEVDSPESESQTTEADTTQTSADQNDAWNPWWIIVIGVLVIVVGLCVLFVVKKKKEDTK